MKTKNKIVIGILCILTIGLYIGIGNKRVIDGNIFKNYKVYLDGNLIGVIDNKDALFALIDEKQQIIKDKYSVSNVYPPNGLEVIENYTYDNKVDELGTIYNKIEELQDFTISGYEVKIGATDTHKEISIYVLDKEVFNEAIKKFIFAFISEEKYNEYINGTQGDLEDIGIRYEDMGILEDITIREKYISTEDKIYENSEELAQELLFGFNHKELNYTVKSGDTIESISDSHTLNTQEFLIANPRYSSKDSLLAVGDKVNVTLIDPEISFVYSISERKEVEKDFSNTIVRDNSKESSYSEITTPGVKGLSIQVSNYNVTNGEPSSETKIIEDITIREVVNQVTTKGRKISSSAPGGSTWGRQTYTDTGSGWRWPSENPYQVTSEFAYRWGRHHNGIDISGSGFGSRIYSANDGVVTRVVSECSDVGTYGSKCGGGFGNYVVINHGNNIYTVYAHLKSNIPVRVGAQVARGTVVGYMGSSGSSTGTHLHFGLSVGDPNNGGTYQNPRSLYKY